MSKPHHVTVAKPINPEPEDNFKLTALVNADDDEEEVDGPEYPLQLKPKEAEKMRHYETTTARVMLHEHESVSCLNIDQIKIKDFDAYFLSHYNDLLE